jgi:DNA-binding transcriptional MerR regulator
MGHTTVLAQTVQHRPWAAQPSQVFATGRLRGEPIAELDHVLRVISHWPRLLQNAVRGIKYIGLKNNKNTHRIQKVAKLAGLSKDVIRVRERRYGPVKPSRSSYRYREYCDEEVALLRFMKAQMEQGATIGALAAEGRDSLVPRMHIATPVSAEEQKPHERLLDDLMGSLPPLDTAGFERRLNGAMAVIPFEKPSSGFFSHCNNESANCGTTVD